jgi:hypothetical protein
VRACTSSKRRAGDDGLISKRGNKIDLFVGEKLDRLARKIEQSPAFDGVG